MPAATFLETLVYTLPWCPYASRGGALLARREVGFEEIDVSVLARSRG